MKHLIFLICSGLILFTFLVAGCTTTSQQSIGEQNGGISSPSETITPIPTISSIQYNDESYNFSFEYPKDYNLTKKSDKSNNVMVYRISRSENLSADYFAVVTYPIDIGLETGRDNIIGALRKNFQLQPSSVNRTAIDNLEADSILLNYAYGGGKDFRFGGNNHLVRLKYITMNGDANLDVVRDVIPPRNDFTRSDTFTIKNGQAYHLIIDGKTDNYENFSNAGQVILNSFHFT